MGAGPGPGPGWRVVAGRRAVGGDGEVWTKALLVDVESGVSAPDVHGLSTAVAPDLLSGVDSSIPCARPVPSYPQGTPQYDDGDDDGERLAAGRPSIHQDALQATIGSLRKLGFTGARTYARQHDLADVAEAVADCEAAIEAHRSGVTEEWIRNPAGLIRYLVRQAEDARRCGS